MASAHKTKVGYEVRWRFAGRQFNQSVGDVTSAEADAFAGQIDDTLNAIKRGWVKPPAEADYATIKAFIFSGGQEVIRTAVVAATRPLTLSELFRRYEAELTASTKDASSRKTEGYHIAHIRRVLGDLREVETIALRDVQGYVDARASQVSRETIKKEAQTFRFIWNWAFKRGHLKVAVPWTERELTLPKARSKEPFRTMAEIEARIRRGGMSERGEKAWWEALYLTGQEMREVLSFVEANRTADWVFPLVALCILTGCRRSEALRSEPTDFDFEGGTVHIREKKKNSAYEFTRRTVGLHPRLAEIMVTWLASRPEGFAGITKDMTNDHLTRTLAKSEKWRNIKGFHVFRHSFASALAIRGVDQRVIDALMGHGTEEMAKRYRHIAQHVRQSAVDDLLS